MHELDEGTEKQGAALERTPDFAVNKLVFDTVERSADVQQHVCSLCLDSAYRNTVSC